MMQRGLDFEVDKITKSIEEIATGISYPTEVQLITSSELANIHKKDGWHFNWKKEGKHLSREIYKLSRENDDVIQGLISIEFMPDERYIEMHLIENAPRNFGPGKEFDGVAANLIAFVCKLSFLKGYSGIVAFTAKTKLVDYYARKLGAQSIFGKGRMAIFENEARNLVNSYFKNFFYEP